MKTGLFASASCPLCHVERKSKHLFLFLREKVRDSSTVLGMTKNGATRNELLWRRLHRSRSDAILIRSASILPPVIAAVAALAATDSKPERDHGVARETESAERFVKIFAKGERLKISAQHFRM